MREAIRVRPSRSITRPQAAICQEVLHFAAPPFLCAPRQGKGTDKGRGVPGSRGKAAAQIEAKSLHESIFRQCGSQMESKKRVTRIARDSKIRRRQPVKEGRGRAFCSDHQKIPGIVAR